MSMNLSKLRALVDGKRFTKAYIVKHADISRPALDAILEGKDFKVSNLVKIAAAVGVPVSYFFDEETEIDIRTAGRDYVERGDIIHNADPASLTSSGAVPVAPGGVAHAGGCIGAAGADADALAALAAENADLRRRLIEAQSKIIALMESRR